MGIVKTILHNLSKRKGIGDELDAIDPEIYREMVNHLIDLTIQQLEKI